VPNKTSETKYFRVREDVRVQDSNRLFDVVVRVDGSKSENDVLYISVTMTNLGRDSQILDDTNFWVEDDAGRQLRRGGGAEAGLASVTGPIKAGEKKSFILRRHLYSDSKKPVLVYYASLADSMSYLPAFYVNLG
jgi:hypothetical protein